MAIRLVNNVDETEGRGTIEIEFNGVKGSVCDDDCIEGRFLLEIFRHCSLFMFTQVHVDLPTGEICSASLEID